MGYPFSLSYPSVFMPFTKMKQAGRPTLRSGNIVPEVISSDLSLSEPIATDLATDNVPVPKNEPAPVEVPITSSNSSE